MIYASRQASHTRPPNHRSRPDVGSDPRQSVTPAGVVEVEAFPGRAPVAVDLDKAAPFGWWAAIVIALVAFIDRVEFNLVAGALPAIQDHFGFSDTLAGAIPTAAAVAGVILLLPAGRLADRGRAYDDRRSGRPDLGRSARSLSGLATTFAMFFVIRILLGARRPALQPAGLQPARRLLPAPAAARKAYGLERAGYYMGLPVGVVLGGALADAVGWRTVFFIVAVPGVVVAAPRPHPAEPIRGLGDRTRRRPAPATVRPPTRSTSSTRDRSGSETRDLLRIPTLRGVILSLSMLYLGLGGLFYWMPTFLVRIEGVERRRRGRRSPVPSAVRAS